VTLEGLAFCTWLTQQDYGGPAYRLPTEAEWEYACRAGTTTAWHWGNQAKDGQGWCNVADRTAECLFPGWEGAVWDCGYAFTSPVGAFRSNPWGLFGMRGNVWEWCQDWYGPYPEGDARDPTGPASSQRRVIRGGSWHHVLARCRSAARFKFEPDYCNVSLGGRVCFSAPGVS
jgi:formylglycine-generating enzyme required for sulfatase activity